MRRNLIEMFQTGHWRSDSCQLSNNMGLSVLGTEPEQKEELLISVMVKKIAGRQSFTQFDEM